MPMVAVVVRDQETESGDNIGFFRQPRDLSRPHRCESLLSTQEG